MLLALLFIFLFLQCERNSIEEPIEDIESEGIDSCDQYIGMKNVFKLEINGDSYEFDSISLSGFTTDSESNELYEYMLWAKTDSFSVTLILNFDYPYGNIYVNDLIQDSLIYDLSWDTTSAQTLRYDGINKILCTEFIVNFDNNSNGVDSIHVWLINIQEIIPYYPQNYVLDTTKEYSFARRWYYVGGTDGSLSNFNRPVPITLSQPSIDFTSIILGSEYSEIYKYQMGAGVNRGDNFTPGSWQMENDSIHAAFISMDYHFTFNNIWEKKWLFFCDSLFTNENNYHFEKENNILKVFFDNNKQCLIYYAKPEEYDYIPSKSNTLKTRNYEEQNNKPTIERFLHWNN